MKTPTYLGNPCRKGHNGERYQSTGHCIHCQREHSVAASEARSEIPTINLHVYQREVQAMGLFALTLAAAHWPDRDLTSYVKRGRGRTSALGAIFLKVPCHPSDRSALKTAAAALRAQRENLVGRDVLGAVFKTAVAGGAMPRRTPYPAPLHH